MDVSIRYLLEQISILHSDSDPRESEFVSYKIGDNNVDTMKYAVNELSKAQAILITHRVGVYENSYGIAYVQNNEQRLLHNVAFEDFIDVLNCSNITDEQLSIIIKNCNNDHQERITGYLENKKLDSLIKTPNEGNQLLF